jgi:hypothetical protein
MMIDIIGYIRSVVLILIIAFLFRGSIRLINTSFYDVMHDAIDDAYAKHRVEMEEAVKNKDYSLLEPDFKFKDPVPDVNKSYAKFGNACMFAWKLKPLTEYIVYDDYFHWK